MAAADCYIVNVAWNGRCEIFAVHRLRPKGGRKLIAVYFTRAAAERIVTTLNSYQSEEV